MADEIYQVPQTYVKTYINIAVQTMLMFVYILMLGGLLSQINIGARIKNTLKFSTTVNNISIIHVQIKKTKKGYMKLIHQHGIAAPHTIVRVVLI